MEGNRYVRRRRRKNRRRIVAILMLTLTLFALAGYIVVKFTKVNVPFVDRSEFRPSYAYSLLERNPTVIKTEAAIQNYQTELKQQELETKIEELRKEIAKQQINGQEKMLEADNGVKVAYLTFDDGPSAKSTPKILKILDDYNIKATFFVLGKSLEYNKEILKDIYARGHAIGNHSYTHDYKKIYASVEAFKEDMMQNDRLIKEVLGKDFQTSLLRCPGGCFGKKMDKFKVAAAEIGYTNYNWNCLNGDAEGRLFSKEHLVQRVKKTAGGQRNLIILMHDTDAKTTTPEALPEIIEYLKSQGYEFRNMWDEK